MGRLKELLTKVRGSWLLLFLVIIMMSLIFHSVTLANIFKASPSEGFSREVKIGQVAYGNSKYNRYHMVSALSIDKESIGILAVDGLASRIFQVDFKGKVLMTKAVALDLSKIGKISTYFLDESHLKVLYGTDTLYATVIDMNTGEFTQVETVTIMDDFDHENADVIVAHEDGLYGINMEQSEPSEVPIVKGDFSSFQIEEKEDLLYLTTVEELDTSFVTGHVLIMNQAFEILSAFTIFPKTDKRLIGNVKDVFYKDDTLTSVFVWSDKRSNQNLMTTLQSDVQTGEQISKFSQSFALSYERVSIDHASKGQVSLIMQDNLMGGQNIVYNTLEDGKDTVTVPLSKIRGVSALPDYYDVDGKKILIFCDLNKTVRDIYIASSDPELIQKTTSYDTINFGLVIGTSIFVFIVALFTALIMILVLEPIPTLVLILLYHLTQKYKYKFRIQLWVPVALHTAIKIFVSFKMLETVQSLSEVNLGMIGTGLYVYTVLIASSLFSMLCVYKSAKQRNDHDSVNNYIFFVLFDLSLFAFTYVSFLLSSLLIYKL